MTRVAVIGAGIAGASAAYHLADAGADVVVVDDARNGRATSAGAGILTPVSARPTDDVKSRFMFEAVRHYLDMIRSFERAGHDDHSYGAVGQLILALEDAQLADLDGVMQRAERLTAEYGVAGAGTPYRLPARELAARFPRVSSTAAGAVWLPQVARIDGHTIRELLMHLAVERGARLIDQSADALLTDDGCVRGVRTPEATLYTDHVVLAGGTWSAGLAATAGVDLPVYPQRGQIVHLRMPGGSALPVMSAFNRCYLLSFPGDRVVIGATREDDSGFDPHATVGGIDMLFDRGRAVVPAVQEAQWLEVRVGLRPASPDGEPFIGPATGVAGLWLATGFGPQGLTLAPRAGQLVAASILGESADIPGIFAPDRPR
ncbi:FAD-dependent oxidoreductase [Actinobacteria bacterium YIM 96077]|uniref:FAD-dependent oxidoreductase n=1 Tax=Phytoactinopolyspora halophila TaxID=1981511 RepID=A0A329QM15_9ACTN|nr:FAD-dependent oxidoreductase [Phytoactinopolyspora halophila]AYY12932.1 FAD-dependent oxidoreductase [Actinobacteria bacterium YIM 96077]RAW13196.1 FAD-dependent oxidoreductase [Phytoactinopolyspora halophila]